MAKCPIERDVRFCCYLVRPPLDNPLQGLHRAGLRLRGRRECFPFLRQILVWSVSYLFRCLEFEINSAFVSIHCRRCQQKKEDLWRIIIEKLSRQRGKSQSGIPQLLRKRLGAKRRIDRDRPRASNLHDGGPILGMQDAGMHGLTSSGKREVRREGRKQPLQSPGVQSTVTKILPQ